MSAGRRPPTLRDVARRAGVHPATVSRALSRPSMVAPATRTAVLEAVEQVGFVPNRSARQLVSGRFDAIGVLVPDITNPYFAAIVRAIQGDARRSDLSVVMADTGADPAEERRALGVLAHQVDGVVAITPSADLARSAIPVVQVNRRSRGVPSVVVDQRAIVELAVEHLVERGHTRLVVARGPAAYWSSARRAEAVRPLIEAHRGRVRIDLTGPTAPTFEGGRALAEVVATSGASAVVAFNDLQAAGLLVALGERDPAAVPRAVVGSDGLDLATMTSPPMTTVAAPLDDLGRVALERLHQLLAGDRPQPCTTLEPHLVVRDTTPPPPDAAGTGTGSARIRTEPARTAPARTEPAGTEPARTEPTTTISSEDSP